MSEYDRQCLETDRADRAVFVQELLLSSLSEGLRLDDDSDDIDCDIMKPAETLSSEHPTSGEVSTKKDERLRSSPVSVSPSPHPPPDSASPPIGSHTGGGVRSKQPSVNYKKSSSSERSSTERSSTERNSSERSSNPQVVLSHRAATNRVKRGLDYSSKATSNERESAAYAHH